MVLIAPEAEAPGKHTAAGSVNQTSFASSVLVAMGLLAFYCLASLFMDPGGYLSTDTGGKTATVAAMSERSDWSPEIGYWAEEWDPQGDLHPYWGTQRRGDMWVNVTSVPMILAARPLWDVGGSRAVLLLPMLGSVFAALAAGRLSVQFGAKSARPTVLLVGLASPAAVYALDFWEHSIGLALMGWGFVWVLEAQSCGLNGRSQTAAIIAGAGAGAVFGFAANLRQEALIYGLVAGIFLVGSLLRTESAAIKPDRRHRAWCLLPGAAMAGAALAMVLANVALERIVFGETARIGRSAGSIYNAGSAGIGLRLTEAAITFASPVNTDHWSAIGLAALVAGGLIWTTISLLRSGEMQRPLALVGLSLMVVMLRLATFGPAFISGMMAAAPLAGAGIGLAWVQKRKTPLVLALAPLPLVWYFQFPGAAAPQWGGRYVLATGLLLTAYAMGQWERFGDTFALWTKSLVVASGVITLVGLAFLSERSHGFAAGSEALADRAEPVLIFENPFLPREAGPLGTEERWLAAPDRRTRDLAAELVIEAGFESFAYVGSVPDGFVEFDHFVHIERAPIVFLVDAETVYVTTYERVP